MKEHLRLVFREGRTKAVGTITKLFPHITATAQNTRQQRSYKKAAHAASSADGTGPAGPLRPQNEPQKPSKRGKRSRARHDRGYPSTAAAEINNSAEQTLTTEEKENHIPVAEQMEVVQAET